MIEGDTFQRFLLEELHIRGEWVRLSDSYQEATKDLEYPENLRSLLGQAAAASVLLTGTLKFDGRLSIHARGEGVVNLLMAEATNRRTYRGIVDWQGEVDPEASLVELLGNAQLAITIDPDKGNRYQGVVPLERENLADCLAHYFELSEQLDTFLMLEANENGCFGLMLQKLPDYKDIEDQDAWNRIAQFAKTLKIDEFMAADNETLLLRLFHEEKVLSFDKEPVKFECSCSRERTLSSIETLGQDEALEILENTATIAVDCQFCRKHYEFDRADIVELFRLGSSH